MDGSTLQRLEQSNLPLARQLKTFNPPQEVADHRTSGKCLQRLFEGVVKSLANTGVEVSPQNDLAKSTQSSPRVKVPIRWQVALNARHSRIEFLVPRSPIVLSKSDSFNSSSDSEEENMVEPIAISGVLRDILGKHHLGKDEALIVDLVDQQAPYAHCPSDSEGSSVEVNLIGFRGKPKLKKFTQKEKNKIIWKDDVTTFMLDKNKMKSIFTV
jgi:hypothetical protein